MERRKIKTLAAAIALASSVTLAPAPSPQVSAAGPTSPLEASGLVPIWREDFPDGTIETLQYSWADGNNAALRSYVQPGAIYLGQDGPDSSYEVEQQINHFKGSSGEPLPQTIEFDVFSPNSGSGRVSLRPRRRGDMVHIRLGLSGDKTNIGVRFIDTGTTISYQELTGPTRGWAHVVLSYEQYLVGSTWHAHYVVAINGEVHEISGPSGITDPDFGTYWASDPAADGWSIEHNSALRPFGKFIANVRGYQEFIPLAEMQTRLVGQATYRAGLADPRTYTGPTRGFQLEMPLATYGPNPIAYADATGPLEATFDGSFSSSWAKITSHLWNFGDGTTGAGRRVVHTYATPGTYTATLTVQSQYGSASRQVQVAVGGTGGNQAPSASDDAYSLEQDSTKVVAAPGVLGDDSDPDSDPLSAVLATDVGHGSLSLAADGGFSYTPDPGYVGPDAFTYRASDGDLTSSPATVSLTVTATPPVGQISFVASTSASRKKATSLTIPRPTATAEGDLMVAALTVGSAATIAPPTGWTTVISTASSTALRQAVFSRLATNPEPASYTWTISATSHAVGAIATYRGAQAVDIAGGQGNGKSTSIAAPSVTTSQPATRLVGVFSSAAATTIAADQAMTERVEVPAPGTNKPTLMLADQALGSIGPSGGRTAIASASARSVGQLVALR